MSLHYTTQAKGRGQVQEKPRLLLNTVVSNADSQQLRALRTHNCDLTENGHKGDETLGGTGFSPA